MTQRDVEAHAAPGPKRRPTAGAPLWFGLVFAAAGLASVALGVALARQEAALASDGVTLTGVVTDKRIETGDDSTSFRLVYEFAPSNGRSFRGSTSVDESRYRQVQVGDPITVTYLPDNPTTNRAGRAEDVGSPAPIAFGGVGGLFAVIGIVILLDDHRHVRGRVTKDAPLVNAGPPPTSLVARRPG